MSELLAKPQAEPSGPGPAAARRWLAGAGWLVFGVVFFLAVYVRCVGLIGRGIDMGEPDTWKYLQVAYDWTHGHYTWMGNGGFYRPTIHLIHMWLWRAFGVNQYVIKIANVAFDSCTLLLIFLITRSLAKSVWAGVAAASLYAFVPNVIRNVWIEQHYSPGTCLILLAVGLAVWSQHTRRHAALGLPMLGLCGFALGAVANMHADLALAAPGLVFGIAWVTVAHKPADPCDRVIANIAVFLAGFACVYGLGIFFLGAKEVVDVASREFFRLTDLYDVKGAALGYFGRLWRVLHESFSGLLQQRLLMLYAFLSAVLVALFLPLRRWLPSARRASAGHGEPGLVLLPVLSYVLLFALTIGWFKSWLLFYPLYPLVVISVVYWHHRFFSGFLGSWATWATVAGALLVAWHSPHVTPGTALCGPDRLMPACEFLRGRVDEQNRVLVLPTGDPHAPFPAFYSTAGLASPVYLGSCALYVPSIHGFPLPYTAESLRQVCLKNHIRYVLNLKTGPWERFWTDETLKFFPQFQILGAWQPYSYEAEQEVVRTFLTSVGATEAMDIENGLFELPPADSHAMKTRIDAPIAPFTPEVLHTKKVWDFRSLDPQSFSWFFPGMVRIKTPYGAISTITYGKLAYIDLRNVRVPADSLNGVWIEAMLDDKATDVLEQYPLPRDTEALFLWAREGDYQPGEFPYVLVRRTALARVNANEPFLFVTTLKDRSPLWSGAITDMAIRFHVKSGPISGAEAHLIVRRIGFF